LSRCLQSRGKEAVDGRVVVLLFSASVELSFVYCGGQLGLDCFRFRLKLGVALIRLAFALM
ncbi:hypothetical protein U1Q18_028701, partial [Sarracenia purpurea var. burkii]